MADPSVFISCLILFLIVGPLPGYSSNVCPDKFFGWKCKLPCENCRNGTCDSVTGECQGGCLPGYYGHHCIFKDEYIYDFRGIQYKGHLSKTADNKDCLDWKTVIKKSDSIRFEEGDDEPHNYCRNPLIQTGGRLNIMWCYTLDSGEFGQCNLQASDCPPYLFGDGCKNQCHCRDNSEVCNQNGLCQSGCAEGWIDPSCQKECDHGKYGLHCKFFCNTCHNSDCNPETGHCLKGCIEGFTGEACNKVCNGTYGRNCKTSCGHCLNNDTCNFKTGDCPEGCQPGYKTVKSKFRLCNEACHGRYGVNCETRCGACLGGHTVCDTKTGVCPNGCQDGYMNEKCDTMCSPGFYGRNCSFKCGVCRHNATCDPLTGKCPFGCGDKHGEFDCGPQAALKPDNNTAHIALGSGLGLAVLLILLFAVFCVIYRTRRSKNLNVSKSVFVETGDDTMPREESCHLLGDSRVGKEPPSFSHDDDEKGGNGGQEPIYVNINARKQTSPVAVSDLLSYILKNKEHSWEGFKREFEELPMGLLAQCEIARKLENKVKNRYGNIVAYDHSRVILDLLPNEPFSDYVNANFMDGYGKPKAYIASQGPNKIMIRDFWRMVWQHKVSKIIMLTNLMEACKKKCEQYWPDEGSQKYGDLTVLHVNVTKYSDFIIRTFELSKEMENSRIVKQFHFTTWSDHGAPTYPTTLLAFRRKVMNFKPEDTAPVLSHCSAGIGRTGTFIALNYLLDQAMAENQVDVLRCAQLMRANRVNMIQTLEQYVFVYDAVLEALMAGNTTISRSSFHTAYEQMLMAEGGELSPMEKQQNVLQLLSPTIEREECSVAFQEQNMSKNRFKNILPANRSRPYLYTPVEGCNEYINAVYMSGYTQKDQFIVTQMPLPSTVADFWRMLYDTSSDTIIMLNEFDRNDKTCALYWPEEYGYTEEHGPLSVELLSSSDSDPDVTIRIFKLSHLDKGEERAIKQFMFKSWPDYQTVPNSINPLLRLHRLVNDWLKQNSKGPVTVHCMNGASKSGVFVAISLLLERLELDYEVDVYQTVKQIRVNRPQLIENLEQYKFLYQVVQEYMDQE